jgi:hypothetical protein
MALEVARMVRSPSALLLVALLPACGGDDPPPGAATAVHLPGAEARYHSPVVEAEERPDVQETVYSVTTQNCSVSWTVYASELNRGVVRHSSQCRLALEEQIPLMAALLRTILDTDPHAAAVRTLSWGRLYPDGEGDVTMAERLALAAFQSPGWDRVEGRPRQGDLNNWTRALAMEASIYQELGSLFRDAGLEVHLASMEKVLVDRADRLPFFGALMAAGAQGSDKVPFDGQVWFSVGPPGGPDYQERR